MEKWREKNSKSGMKLKLADEGRRATVRATENGRALPLPVVSMSILLSSVPRSDVCQTVSAYLGRLCRVLSVHFNLQHHHIYNFAFALRFNTIISNSCCNMVYVQTSSMVKLPNTSSVHIYRTRQRTDATSMTRYCTTDCLMNEL
jgi:hypothetical protein